MSYTEKDLMERSLAELTEIFNSLNPENQIKKFKIAKTAAIAKILNSLPVEVQEEQELTPDAAIEVSDEVVFRPIELMNPKDVSDRIPELVVLESPLVKGPDIISGVDVEYNLSDKFKIAGHVDPESGEFKAVRTLKTLQYNELSHEHTFNTLTTSLAALGLDFGVWRAKYTEDYDIATYDFLLNRQYKINEDLFETQAGIQYNGHDDQRVGVYQPMIRLTNSFLGSSRLEFALVRILCYNGMLKIADKLSISFPHITSNIIQIFENKCNVFLDSIFSRHYIEDMAAKFQAIEMNPAVFVDWLYENAGKRSAERAVSKFRLDTHIWNKFTAWTGYNVLTYLTTHLIDNLRKQNTLLTGFNSLIGYTED